MGSAIISDPALRLVAWTAVALFGTSLLCLLYSQLLRFRRQRREARQRELAAVWQGLCFAAMVSDLPATLPALHRRDARLFAEIWLDCMDRVRGGAAKTGLMHLARRADLTRFLLSRIRSRTTDDQLIVLLCLGAMQDTRVMPLALRSLDSSYPLISLAAARALMEIDPHNATPLLLQRLTRPGWPLGRLRQLLQLAPPAVRNRCLSAALDSAPEPLMIRLLALCHELAESDTEPAMQLALRRFPDDPAVLAQVLRLTAAPHNLALARSALHHDHEPVRQAALGALGRLGSLRDVELLVGHLDQDSWINQQAAAHALMALPGMQPAQALDILPGLTRQSGRLHWLQALSERGWLPANLPTELPRHARTA